jgi:hypothetical protein
MCEETLRSYLRHKIDHADKDLLITIKNMLDEYLHVQQEKQFDLSEEEKEELTTQYNRLLKGEVKTYTEQELRDHVYKNRKSKKAS